MDIGIERCDLPVLFLPNIMQVVEGIIMSDGDFQLCYHCKKFLPPNRFVNGHTSPQKNRVYCDICTTIMENKRAVAKKKKGERQKERLREDYHNNKDKYRERNRLNRLKHLEKRKQYDRIYYRCHAKKAIAYQKKHQWKYSISKRQNDPVCNFYRRISCGLWGALKKRGYTKKNISVIDILGAPLPEVWRHLTDTYKINYKEEWGGQPYHIDHIVPLCTARAKEDVLKLYHYSNLQMLSPIDNKTKNSNLRWKSSYQETKV